MRGLGWIEVWERQKLGKLLLGRLWPQFSLNCICQKLVRVFRENKETERHVVNPITCGAYAQHIIFLGSNLMLKSAVGVESLPVNTCIPHFSINLTPVHLKQQR